MRRRPWSYVWSACEQGRLHLSGSASGRPSSRERYSLRALGLHRGSVARSRLRDVPWRTGHSKRSSLFWVWAGSCWRCCLPSERLLPRSVSHGTPWLHGRGAPSLVVWSAACGGAECLSTRLVSGEEPWLVRASDRTCLCLLYTPYRVRGLVGYGFGSVSCVWSAQGVMWGCWDRGASRMVAGDSIGGPSETGLGRSSHLGAWLDECCWSYASPAVAVRVWSRPCAVTLAPGLREAPDYAPG